MELLGALSFSLLLAFITQIPCTSAEDCPIAFIKSQETSSLTVKWNRYPKATNYFLDLRNVGSTSAPPIVITVNSSATERIVYGLKSATTYSVTLKCFEFYNVICQNSTTATTVPGTTQITFIKAISSTAIKLQWDSVYGAEQYYVVIESNTKNSPYKSNRSYTELSAVVTDLKSATSYYCSVYTANIGGLGASSKVWTISTLTRPPVPVTITQTGETKAHLSWEAVEKVLLYRVTISDLTSTELVKSIAGTFLDIPIVPCTTYHFSVSSYNPLLEAGEPTNTTFTASFSRKPIDISLKYTCDDNVTVTWEQVQGAEFYEVVAVDSHNMTLTCTSQSTVCHIAGVNCSEWYTVRVTAISSKCNSMTYNPIFFETVPCAPTNVSIFRECSSNLIIISWASSNNTDYYNVTSTDSVGMPMDCVTSEKACFFTNTNCGRGYRFNVYAMRGKCSSKSSPTVYIKTAPCQPKKVWSSSECYTDVLVSIWELAAGAQLYTVEALGNKPNHNIYSCNSTGTNCSISGLQCGEALSVWITTSDEECSSGRALGDVGTTVPCIPQNVLAVVDCASNSVRLDWEYSHGASFYVGSVIGNDGTNLSCSTTDTHCIIQGLSCGQIYSAYVVAVHINCNSKESMHVIIETGACPPQNIKASLDCSGSEAFIEWEASQTAVSYTATLDDGKRSLLNCTSTGNYCMVHSLKCDQAYQVSVFAHHPGTCHTTQSKPILMDSVSCGPKNVRNVMDCGTRTLDVNWDAMGWVDGYVTVVTRGNGEKTYCNTTMTNCTINNLSCGESYSVVVMFVNGSCLSRPSKELIIQKVPCTPTNVTATHTCNGSSISITWAASQGAIRYKAVAQSTSGHMADCSSNWTSCSIFGLQCGQVYSVGVAAVGSNCTSSQSKTIMLQTAPCAPTNVTIQMVCTSNSAFVSWNTSPKVVSYTVRAVGQDGHITSCNNTLPSCHITGLHCSNLYTFTVSAQDGTCQSLDSAPLQQSTAVCPPSNLSGQVLCADNSLMVTWNPGAKPGAIYILQAQKEGGASYSYTTSDTSYNSGHLQCGERYSFRLSVQDTNCNSSWSPPITLDTVPCAPTDLKAQVECGPEAVQLSWAPSISGVTYFAVAVGDLGQKVFCSSNGSSCSMKLDCGQSYTATVYASGSCSSPTSDALKFDSAPCFSENMILDINCTANAFNVQWGTGLGQSLYSALAISHHGHRASCNTTKTNCTIRDLQCGQMYNITASSSSKSCSFSGSHYQLQSAPCVPENPTLALNCSTNIAIVSWDYRRVVQMYQVVAVDSEGQETNCSTTGNNCTFSSLACGERYNFSLVGITDKCESAMVHSMDFLTASCPPTNVKLQTTCISNSASISWATAKGAVKYAVKAESDNGQVASCSSKNTSCDISGLQCGQSYKVSITALSKNCVDGQSEMHTLETAPCEPLSVKTQLDCKSGDLTVSWSSSSGANHYWAEVKSDDFQVFVCKTSNTTCLFPYLPCGHSYNVTVVAGNNGCNSSYSSPKLVTTAPCPPTYVKTTVNCTTNTILITWSPHTQGAWYSTTFWAYNSSFAVCNTAESNCTVSNLPCGREYEVQVTPERDGCKGSPSMKQTVRTVPCIPSLSDVKVNCQSDFAVVHWKKSMGAEQYKAVAVNGEGMTSNCSSSNSSCNVLGLQCGQQYTFMVTASNLQCSSSPSRAIQPAIVPCAPTNVSVKMICANRTVRVSWSPSYGAENYMIMLNDRLSCRTDSFSCDIGGVTCGLVYIVTVVAHGNACDSPQSKGIPFSTGTCPPENIKASLNCDTSAVMVTWNTTWGAQLYKVEAISSSGHKANCSSPWASCQLTDLLCGQDYTITVKAHDANCFSEKSTSVGIKSVPCTPGNVDTYFYCETRAMTISWNESEGADSYIVTVEDDRGFFTSCQTMDSNSCNVTGLDCGVIYKVTVEASNGHCNSPKTSIREVDSVPCMPTNIKASLDCEINTATVIWAPGSGAYAYIATAMADSGHRVTCSVNDTNCEMQELLCGELYTVFVLAVGYTCNSSAIVTKELMTQPCVPLIVNVWYSQSIGQVLWDPSEGASSYSVEAVTSQGLQATCSTEDTNCALYSLACDQVYNITVTANNQVCSNTVTSDPSILATEPCQPKEVQARMDCRTNEADVSWEGSSEATGFVVNLDGRNGDSLSCYTTGTSCKVGPVHCGTVYYVGVQALGTTYNSSESTPTTLVSAPCVVDWLDTQVDCKKDTALVSWSFTDGADFYKVSARSINGDTACSTNPADYKNFCNLTNLICGTNYIVSLVSVNEQCEVLSPNEVFINTRPCPPSQVDVNLQCGNNTAVLHWYESDGVDHYIASAKPTIGSNSITCNTSTSSCVFPSLDCKMTFSFTVTAYSTQCQSEPSKPVEVTTEPCQPQSVVVNRSCTNDTIMVQWQNRRRADYYLLSVDGDLGYVVEFETSDMTLKTPVLCGQSYSISVRGRDNETCDGPSSNLVHFITGPCIPHKLQSYVQCEDSMVAVVWAETEGAETYEAVAVGQQGDVHTCNTTGTNCTWDNLQCSDVYTISVTAADYQCHSLPSNNITTYTAPCPPDGIKANLNCSNRVVSLTWEASEMTSFYTVAMYAGPQLVVELSSKETHADFSEISCSQEYTFTVTAWHSTQCRSAPSAPVYLTTEPCSPSHVLPTINCYSRSAVVTWAPVDKVTYYVATFQTEDGWSQNCTSPHSGCSLPYLPCGRTYSVFVTAVNKQCNSIPSIPTTLQTVPCIPEGINIVVDCPGNAAMVSWNHSLGAESYRVSAMNNSKIVSRCESNSLHCKLTDLPCGKAFTVNVIAVSKTCSSVPSRPAHFKTAPCPPKIIYPYLDCNINSLLMQWENVDGAMSYTALAESQESKASCRTTETNCEINSLVCGQLYTVTLLASDEQCNSSLSTSYNIVSVPCVPQNVKAQMNCSANMAYVEWDDGTEVELYLVKALGTQGSESSCSVTESACHVPNLLCGDTYNISVLATSQDCNISWSTPVFLQSVPCAPSNVHAYYDCVMGEVVVSWDPSPGATSYHIIAEGIAGYNSSCNTSDTVCHFSDLLCSTPYIIYVIAMNEVCSSLESETVYIETAACAPEIVTGRFECTTRTALVTWEEVDGMAIYYVEAVGTNGHVITCHNVSTYCRLYGMLCDQVYNLSVTAVDYVCNNSIAYLSIESAPCEPHNLNASTCVSNSTLVTWLGSNKALSYRAVGKGMDGHEVFKITKTNSTIIDGLKCGQMYCISVSSSSADCTISTFSCLPVHTAPCPPQNVTTQVNCESGIITVSWNSDSYVDSFNVNAVASDGTQLFCSTTGMYCSIRPTSCGLNYTIHVIASRGECYSSPSMPVVETSAPCVPEGVSGNLSCMTNSVLVKWKPARGAKLYTVVEVGAQNSSWSTSESNFEVTDPSCGMLYTFYVKASNDDCMSQPSASFEIKTAPCLLTSITAMTECQSSIIQVSWETTPALPLYTAIAEANNGSTISCSSTTGTCNLMNSQCDTQYIITVASSDKCSSKKSTPYKISTAPCTPVDIAINTACNTDGISVSWAKSSVAEYYLLMVTGTDGKTQTHNTPVNSYNVSKLPCGNTYYLSITAIAGNCSSPSSSVVTFRTGPCAPKNLEVEMQCSTNSAVLSWNASKESIQYFATAQSSDGDTVHCHSLNTTCTFRGLQCGSMYNFSVQASNHICNSSFSKPVEKGSAPCAPDLVRIRLLPMEDQVQIVQVSWGPVNCPSVTYLVEMTGSIEGDAHKLINVFSYWTEHTFFEIPLPCSTKYTVTVQSRNSVGISKPSTAKSSTIAPCPPHQITLLGDNSQGEIYWSRSIFATEYNVFELSAAGRTRVCKTDQLSCILTNVNLTALEVTASNDVGQSNPSRNIVFLARAWQNQYPPATEQILTPEVNATANGTSLHIQWTPVQGATQYVLTVYTVHSHFQPPKEYMLNATVSTITDLMPATTYCVTVSVAGDNSKHTSSPPVCVTTA